jgi:hypothetical protein
MLAFDPLNVRAYNLPDVPIASIDESGIVSPAKMRIPTAEAAGALAAAISSTLACAGATAWIIESAEISAATCVHAGVIAVFVVMKNPLIQEKKGALSPLDQSTVETLYDSRST